MKKTLIVLFTLLLAFGCFQLGEPEVPSPVENQTEPEPYIPPVVVIEPEPEPTPLELANQSALDFALSSSTYAYDGFGLVLSDYYQIKDQFTFVYLFNSQYSGFGNRSIYFLEQSLSTHALTVVVQNNTVIYAVLDGVYDELDHELIDVAKNFDSTPSDIETCKQIALDFVKQTYPGSQPKTSNYSVNKISDTLYEVTVLVPTSSDGVYAESVRVLVDHNVAFIPNPNLQRYWVELLLDPNADYSQIINTIPTPKCPPGQLVAISLRTKFCYTPTSTNGFPCSSSNSCIRGSCVRTSMGEFGTPTKCMDYPFGCKYWVAEQNQPAHLFCLT